MRKHWVGLTGVLVVLLAGCETPKPIQKVAEPVTKPILKTTETILQERTISTGKGAPQAVIFPREQEEEPKQLKIKF